MRFGLPLVRRRRPKRLPLHLRKTNLMQLLRGRYQGIFVAPFEAGKIGPDHNSGFPCSTMGRAMTDSEQMALIALVLMVNQHLGSERQVDINSMRAGEQAIAALASYGLMEVFRTRFGRWTEAGNSFRREKAGIRRLFAACCSL